MSVVHTVLFQFAADADPAAIQAVRCASLPFHDWLRAANQQTCRRFLSLAATCLAAATQQPYILSIKGGKDHSPEGLQDGITHGFVVEFASTADRDYYVTTDPAHQAFVQTLDGLVTRAVVVDFTNDEY